jgi:hypothetical protein
MANEQPTDTHDIRKLSQHEVDALADRMFNRAISCLFDVQPGLKSDMLIAVACLRRLVRDMPDDGLTVRVWKGGA